MISPNKHIALFLLGGFLFPQVAGSMHYFVITHDFSTEDNNSYNSPEPDSLFHSCVYHIKGFSSGILPPTLPVLQKNFGDFEPLILNGVISYSNRKEYNFLLRGPPLEYFLPTYWASIAQTIIY